MSSSVGKGEPDVKKTHIVFIQKAWEDNIGLLSIVAVLKRHGFRADVLVEEKRTYEELESLSPDVVGYSCYTGSQAWVFASIGKLRRAGIGAKVIVGGPHATFFPDLIENPLIDIVCRGEGEYAVLDYAEALERGEEGHDIPNLCFKTPSGVVRNPLRPLVVDLDGLPFPDRSYYDRYPVLSANPYRIFITGRGCPFRCTFCFNHALHALYGKSSRYVRRRSVANVMAELTRVRDHWGLDQVRFSDDHFALDAAWLKGFAPRYRSEIGRPYTVNARVDVLDEEKIGYLRESGCRLVCFGIETGREDSRNRALKKGITDGQISRAAELLHGRGIRFLTSNIIGLPGETAADAWKTIEINQRIETDLPWYSMMQYYEGTEIHRVAHESGLLAAESADGKVTGYFENISLKQANIGELRNIHSFSIIATKFPRLKPFLAVLARRVRPNAIFRLAFKASYLWLTARRADLTVSALISNFRFYLKRI